MRQTVIETLKREKIDLCQKFIFRMENADNTQLFDSIKISGLQTPLLLWKKGDEVILLHGYQRWLVAKELGLEELPVRIYEKPDNFEEILKAVYLENASNRDLNIVEKSLFINKLIHLLNDIDVFKWMSLLHFPPKENTLDLLRKIAELPLIWQDFIVRKNVPLKRIGNLVKTKVATELENLLIGGIGLNKIEQIINLLNETVLREKREEGELLEDILTTIETENKAGTAGKLALPDAILLKLSLLRYPLLSKYQQEFKRKRDRLKLPKNLRLQSDPGMEKEGFMMMMDIKSENDFMAFVDWLKKYEKELISLTERNFHSETI